MEELISNLDLTLNDLTNTSQEIIQEQQLRQFMLEGHILNKVTFRSGKKEQRYLCMSPDLKTFQYSSPSTQRKQRKIPITSIKSVMVGNDQFKTKGEKNLMQLKSENEAYCFSVVLENRNLDFIATEEYVQQNWVNGLLFAMTNQQTSNLDLLQAQSDALRAIVQRLIDYSNSVEIQATSNTYSATSELHQLQNELNASHREIEYLKTHEKDLIEQLEQKNIYILELESQLHMAKEHGMHVETKSTSHMLSLEETLRIKDEKFLELEQEYSEFKRQIKDAFDKALIEKVKKYSHAREVISNYAAYLKQRTEELEKEVAL